MGGDLVLGGADAPLPLDAERHRHGRRRRAARARRRAAARDLHARLRHDELRRRRRLRHDQHARHAAGDGAAACRSSACGPSSRCSTPATSCSSKELIGDGLIDDPVHDPALHGHPVRRAGRPAARCWRWSTSCPPGARLLGVLDRPHAAAVRRDGGAGRRQRARRARGQHLSLARACWPPTAQLVERAVHDPRGDERRACSARDEVRDASSSSREAAADEPRRRRPQARRACSAAA